MTDILIIIAICVGVICLIATIAVGLKVKNSSAGAAEKKLEAPVIGRKTIQISGMHCAHCVDSVTESLNQIEGVRARVNLSKGCAEVFYDREIQEDVLRRAVEKAGFSVVSIHA